MADNRFHSEENVEPAVLNTPELQKKEICIEQDNALLLPNIQNHKSLFRNVYCKKEKGMRDVSSKNEKIEKIKNKQKYKIVIIYLR